MNKSIILTLGIVIVLALMLVNARSVNEGYRIGDNIADFKLENIDGNKVSLANFPEAKGFIIVFTCNTCPYAIAYESRIIDLAKKYSAKGYQLIAINPNDISQQPKDNLEEMKERAKTKNYQFPYLKDENQEVAKKFGARKTPHTFIIQKQNEAYRLVYIGAIDDSANDEMDVSEKYVENALEELLAGKEVSNKEIRSIGCSIKWKK